MALSSMYVSHVKLSDVKFLWHVMHGVIKYVLHVKLCDVKFVWHVTYGLIKYVSHVKLGDVRYVWHVKLGDTKYVWHVTLGSVWFMWHITKVMSSVTCNTAWCHETVVECAICNMHESWYDVKWNVWHIRYMCIIT